MASFGCINEFTPSIETWGEYSERLEQFFIANAIEDEGRKRAVFLTVVGPATYGLLRNLLSPDAPTSKTLAELITLLNGHYDPVPSEIVERYKFNSRVRRAGESVADYIAELRKLAKYCNYANSLDMMLRDRIVCGIQDDAIQRKLLSEPQLTLARASEIAVAMEAAARDAVDLKINPVSQVQEIKFKQQRSRSSEITQSAANRNNVNRAKNCFRCGDSRHHSAECRYKNAVCHSCKKTGHLKRVCLSLKKSHNKPKVNFVTDSECKQYTMFNLKDMEETFPPIEIACKVQGQPVNFEVDSGAPFSLMPIKTFQKIRRFCPPLEQTKIRLQSYTNHPIKILGITNVEVVFQSRTENLPLLVVEYGNTNLAGRNWVASLDLMNVFDANTNRKLYKVNTREHSLEGLLEEFKEVFSPDLGLVKGVKVHLTCKEGAVPRFFKARPVPYAYKDKIDKEIDRLTADGILEPVKTSDWAAPIVPVLKQDGRIRICGDFKLTVNKATDLEQYPLPKIEDLFAELSGGTSFTKLDLRDAYCQLELDEESKHLVVINTHRGLFRYTRLAFGIASAPAIFQREIDKILQGVNGASKYLDDLLVTGKDEEEHLQNLHEVLSRLLAAGVRLHPEKCKFLQSSVEYLGHRIDKDGLHPVESKIKTITDAPEPENIDELRSFLGLITYYAKFLPNMATLLSPLYKLLESKQPWKWDLPQKEAFRKAKDVLKNSSLLVHFDQNKEVILACDASPYGLGAVLSHETPDGDRPIAFASRSLTKAEKNYSHIEKETLALVFGVTRFRNYLLGRKFTLVTDHRPLVNLLSEDKPVPSVAAARIQRWALTLSAYVYNIVYRKGKLNGNADACSRLPLKTEYVDPPVPAESVLLMQQLNDSPLTSHLIEREIEKCPALNRLRSYIKNGWPRKVSENLQAFWMIQNELTVEENIILRGSRVFVPLKFREFVMDELHSAHQGISAIKALARSYVWWPSIDQDLEVKVRNCLICQQNASAPPSTKISWLTPEKPWERIHIDHAGPVEGHYLLIIIDAKTKWLEVIPVPSTASASTITVLRNLFARFGLPRSLVSDNGTGFCSAEFTSFLQHNGITHIRTAPYHPNSNGLAERAVRTVKTALKKVREGTFPERLSRFLLNFRNTPSASTGVSPAVAMFGRALRTRLDLLQGVGSQTPEIREHSVRKFTEGTPVWVRSFGRGPQWVAGKVLNPVGNVMYQIETPWGNWTRHLDQLRYRHEDVATVVPSSSDVLAPPNLQTGITVDMPTDEVAADTSEPPVLSPQIGIPVSENCSPANLPLLSPHVIVQDTGTPEIRRSERTRKKPERLQF